MTPQSGEPAETCRRCGDFIDALSGAADGFALCKTCFERAPAPPTAVDLTGLPSMRRYALVGVVVWCLCLTPAVVLALFLDAAFASGLAVNQVGALLVGLLTVGIVAAIAVSTFVIQPLRVSAFARDVLAWSDFALDAAAPLVVEIAGDRPDPAVAIRGGEGLLVVGLNGARFAVSYDQVVRANVVRARFWISMRDGLEIHRADGASITVAPSAAFGRRRAKRELEALVAQLEGR